MNGRIWGIAAGAVMLVSLGFAQTGSAQTPQISGVENAANFQPTSAPGGLITIFGTNLATGTSQAQALPLPTNLLGTTVYINGTPAPLLYVSPSQINAQVPYEIAAPTSASVSVEVNQVKSASSLVTIAQAAPAIFTLTSWGTGSGAILNTNYSVIMDNNPVQPGQIVQIYATGLGATEPAVETGASGNGQPTIQTVTATIGGVNAPVTFAGAAPGFVGLDQVNAMVPNSIGTGAQPVVISVNGVQSSPNVTISVVSNTPSPGLIGPTYFGMELSQPYFLGTEPWPSNLPFATVRLNADDVTWADLEPAAGVFDFTTLDQILQGGASHGLTPDDFIYTLVKTPIWASSNPTGTGCSDRLNRPGVCYAPVDVNPDGTGTDAYWQAFVTALVSHECPTPGTCTIQYWEGWNEPNNPGFWQSTTAQLVRMQADAYKIIKAINPNLTVVSPSVAPGGGSIENGITWMTGFLDAGGKNYLDIVGFHGYLSSAEIPEAIVTTLSDWTTLLSSEGLSNMEGLSMLPLWDTEGSWGEEANLPDPDMQTAFLGRYYLLQSAAVQRFYWYSYNDNYGTLEANNVLNQPGLAYGYVYGWLAGATIASPCANTGSIWTCSFTRPGGYKSLAVWDASQTCGNGVCTTSKYTPPSGYVQYRDLAGNVTQTTAKASIQIGLKPILLENQNP
jgi:uncharacterized protein (TIGR03437 family)